MGCSSSTAIGTNQPTRICYTYAGLKDLCTGPKGGFGCFLEKKNLSKPLLDIIRTQYDVILQYPKDLRRATKLQADSTTKKKMGKHFKHKEILLTDESKEEFLSTLMELNQDITGFKVFFKRQTDNTFNSEILRYRELIENHKLQDISPVKALEFTPISQANNTDISNLKAKYISFSIKRKQQTGTSPKTLMLLNRIDFIFLETCLPPIPINKQLIKKNINRFIKTMITDLQQLHQNGIYHLDIKPDNIMYCNGRYKFIDYGLAAGIPVINKDVRHSQGTINAISTYLLKQYHTLRGTPEMMNPIFEILFSEDITPINIAKLPLPQQIFVRQYPDCITTSTTTTGTTVEMFNIAKLKQFMEPYTKLYKFVTELYARADWYSLAITIYAILKHSKIEDKQLQDGIMKLCGISDDEISLPRLDKNLIHAFGLRTSSNKSVQ